jgi:hypothetical protein
MKIKIKILNLMLLLMLASSSAVCASPTLAISVGDSFDFNFDYLETVEINGTNYSDPNADMNESVNVEVIEIKSDNQTVSVKETYSDESTDLVDSAVDSWGRYTTPYMVMFLDFESKEFDPEEYMDFSAPEYVNDTSGDDNGDEDYTFGYFANSDPDAYRVSNDDDDTPFPNLEMISASVAGTYSITYDNATTLIDNLADGREWEMKLVCLLEIYIDYTRSLVTKVNVDYTLTVILEDAEKITTFTISYEEGGSPNNLLGDLTIPGFELYVGIFSLFITATILRKRK